MKRQFLLLLALFVSLTTFAQKNEIKEAEKALKKSDYATAKSNIDKAEGMISGADEKTASKFYYVKAKTYSGLAKTNSSYYKASAEAYNELFKYEKQIGSSKYTNMVKPDLAILVSDVSAKGIKSYQDKNYTAAKDELHEVYLLSPSDTVFLEYAANAAYLDKDYDAAISHYQELWDIGYTGIVMEYSAKSNATGKRESFESKQQSDLMKKSKDYTDFQSNATESKRPTFVKNIAFCYVDKGETEKAIEAVKKARDIDPKDVGLILTEANLHIKLDQKDEFAKLMNEAIKLDPNNAVLYYNLGVISTEQGETEKAIEYYNKAIKLDPKYVDAYINLGSALLVEDQALVEKMNENLNNFDKYDEIKAEQVKLYKEVIPVYETAYELKPDDIDTVRTLMSLYENAELDSKYKEMKSIYDGMK